MTERKKRTVRTPVEIAEEAKAKIVKQIDKALDQRAALLAEQEKQIEKAKVATAKAEDLIAELDALSLTIAVLERMLPKEEDTFTSVELDEV